LQFSELTEKNTLVYGGAVVGVAASVVFGSGPYGEVVVGGGGGISTVSSNGNVIVVPPTRPSVPGGGQLSLRRVRGRAAQGHPIADDGAGVVVRSVGGRVELDPGHAVGEGVALALVGLGEVHHDDGAGTGLCVLGGERRRREGRHRDRGEPPDRQPSPPPSHAGIVARWTGGVTVPKVLPGISPGSR
jgi:hypothetical protein